jgi:hypothetical protein
MTRCCRRVMLFPHSGIGTTCAEADSQVVEMMAWVISAEIMMMMLVLQFSSRNDPVAL